MLIVKLSSTRDYWSSSTGIPHVAEIMSESQFEQIKRFLHFSNNMTASKEDKLSKIRTMIIKLSKIKPIIDKINEQLRKVPIE